MTDPLSVCNPHNEDNSASAAQETAALTYLLSSVVHPIQADIGIIYTHNPNENRHSAQAIYATDTFGDSTLTSFHNALEQILVGLLPTSPPALYHIPHNLFDVALVYPLKQSDEVLLGILVIGGSASSPLTEAHLPQLQSPATIAQILLGHHRIDQHLSQMRMVKQTLELLNTAIIPQQAIEIICEREESLHIVQGAILTFGPVNIMDSLQGTFSYLEIEGIWAHQDSTQSEPDVRIALYDIPDSIQNMLHLGHTITLENHQIEHELGSLVKALALPDSPRTVVTLFPLQTSAHRLGIMILVTEAPHHLTQADRDRYETISRFYSNVLLNYVVLEQQKFLVHGRAILLDAVTDGVLIQVLYHGVPHVMMFNQSFADMFGVDVDQLIPVQTLLEKMQIAQHVQRELHQAWVKNDMRSPRIYSGQFHMTNLKGAPATIAWHSIPFYQDGQVMGRLLAFHDTAPEHTAHALRKELVSRVSHELRTPLTSISGFAELILDMHGSDLPEPAQEYATHILASARHLRDVVSDIIQVTNADVGLLYLNMVHVQLDEILKNIAATMDIFCRPQGISFHFQIRQNLPPVYVDVERITQVLSHLMLNAVQYSPENGNIIVMARLVEDLAALPKSAPEDVIVPCVLVGIHDEGQGITEEDVENVFLPFYRTQVARRERIQGAGLGLAVARSYIEIHRGRIWAEVNPGKQPGGHFLFTLPVTLP